MATNVGNILSCNKCGWFEIFKLAKLSQNQKVRCNEIHMTGACKVCNNTFLEWAGPIWIGSLHNKSFIKSILDNLSPVKDKENDCISDSEIDNKTTLNSNVNTVEREETMTEENEFVQTPSSHDRMIGVLTTMFEEVDSI